ncbi:MAG: histidinol-phosphate transaminase [Exilibacterium sp.]
MSVFKEHIACMNAYQPPLEGRNPAQHMLLDFNERTMPVSESIKRALTEFILSDRLQMYPCYGDITQHLAEYCTVDRDQVMITNGSDQGIDLVFRASCREGDEAIIPGPSFAMYQQCAGVENLKVIEPQYTRNGGFPMREVVAAISPKTRVIVIANPNNPCGTPVAEADILTIAAAAPDAVVLVDECYFEYTRTSVVKHLVAYPNIVVTRTFSKTWGLPSIRFGYILTAAENIRVLLNIRGPYDINQLAVVAAEAALANPQYTKDYVIEVMERAKPLLEQYLNHAGIAFWPSAANYLWLFPDHASSLQQHLRERGILVRPKSDAEGNMGLRITVGTVEQTRELINALKAF